MTEHDKSNGHGKPHAKQYEVYTRFADEEAAREFVRRVSESYEVREFGIREVPADE